jgi:RNA-directed DNA polymerase
LGIAALEDKVVWYAVGKVLNQIWLWVGIVRKKVNWILDLDIRSFFDKLQHDWQVRFVEQRIGDKRVVRLIQKWLKAGVVEDGKWFQAEEGSPQGSVNCTRRRRA